MQTITTIGLEIAKSVFQVPVGYKRDLVKEARYGSTH